MIFNKRYLIILSVCILTACAANRQKTAKLTLNKQVQKTLKLEHDFEIKAGRGEDYDTFKTYT